MATTVLVFGTFDVFHPGHEYFLREAKKHGDRLVVVVARDLNVERIKGRKPHHNENIRLYRVQLCEVVDRVQLGYANWSQHANVLNDIRPDIVCLGYDQRADVPSGPWRVVRVGSYDPKQYKSSLLRP